MGEYLERSKRYKGFHYSVLESNEIQYLHNKTLEMLKVIIPILEKNKIRYMICGGTLLGAVKKGIFIPWDDDIDMCVLEEDYERMIECLMEEAPAWILVQCKKTEAHYYHAWLKVRDRKSKVYPFEPSYKCNGVWIDIYKLKQLKCNEVKYQIAKEHVDYLRRRYCGGGGVPSGITQKNSCR